MDHNKSRISNPCEPVCSISVKLSDFIRAVRLRLDPCGSHAIVFPATAVGVIAWQNLIDQIFAP